MSVSLLPSSRRSGAGRGVLKLVSGTVLAQGLTLLCAPLLTRFYAPEAFGALALYLSIVTVLGATACLRYELAILLPASEEEAANLLGLALLASVLVAALTAGAIWLAGNAMVNGLRAPALRPWLWWIPPTVLVMGWFLALNFWNTRTQHFGRLSIAKVTSAVVVLVCQLGAGVAGLASGGALIVANIAGHGVTTGLLGGQILYPQGRFFLRSIRWSGMAAGARRYRKFPLFSSGSVLLNAVSNQLPAFMLTYFFSAAVLGHYALGLRVLQAPMILIGDAIGQVFFARSRDALAEGRLGPWMERTLHRLLSLILFPMCLLMLVGAEAFAVVFGEPWREAGIYLQILAPWMLFAFLQSPLVSLFSTLEKQEVSLRFNVLMVTARALALLIGGWAGNILLALALFSAAGLLANIGIVVYHCRVLNVSLRRQLAVLVRELAWVALFLLPVPLAWLARATPLATLAAALLAATAYYAGWGFRHRAEMAELLKGFRRRAPARS